MSNFLRMLWSGRERPVRSSVQERVAAYTAQPDYIVDEQTGCWVWQRAERGSGYGAKWHNGACGYAHRFFYERYVGPIPEGLHIDHLCRNRRCVNPDHLEAVTNRENILRGTGFSAVNARKTHCVNGHPFDEENTYIRPDGDRDCRACKRVAHAKQDARRRALKEGKAA